MWQQRKEKRKEEKRKDPWGGGGWGGKEKKSRGEIHRPRSWEIFAGISMLCNGHLIPRHENLVVVNVVVVDVVMDFCAYASLFCLV